MFTSANSTLQCLISTFLARRAPGKSTLLVFILKLDHSADVKYTHGKGSACPCAKTVGILVHTGHTGPALVLLVLVRHRQSLAAAGCSAVLCTLSAVGLTALSGMSPMDPPLLQPTGTSAGTPRVRPKGVREELWGPGHHTAASHLCLGRC